MLNRLSFIIVLLITINLQLFAQQKPQLLFYCGITMVKPIKEIAKIIEQKYDCEIKISQGGSKDLYDSLKYAKVGDLYLPGSDSYRIQNMKDGFLLEGAYIGYNQAALFVQKNNPKKIKDLEDLVNPKLGVTLCDPNSGSIGKMTKKILEKYKGKNFFFDAYDNVTMIGTDSRNLNKALIDKHADVTINWRATAFWPENSPYVDIVPIDEKLAPKKRLVINLLSFSKYPDIAQAFMRYAKSIQGQEIMKKYGFVD